MVANSSAMGEVVARARRRFDKMQREEAVAQWYINEGMEEQEIAEARENIVALQADYIEACKEPND